MCRNLLIYLMLLGSSLETPAQEPPPRPITVRLQESVPVTVMVEKNGQQVIETRIVPQTLLKQIPLQPSRSAIIICDMWDKHWCPSATKRCDALAKKAGPIIEAARQEGMTIIHCPSDTMKFYAEHPARLRAKSVKAVKPPAEKDLPNPPLPIDDSDGGCDDVPAPNSFRAWNSQHAAISIDPKQDFITDVGTEVYSILQDRKIERVFVMGVHTNMCVLHRSFAIKQLRRWNVDCYLVRDLTDTMYNPKKPPFVSHDKGTELVIEYIEQHWCPSVLSDVLKKK